MRPIVLKGIFATLTLVVISFSVYYVLLQTYSPQFEEITYASYIQDGDTFQTLAGDWIRLADVDCPESYEYGYSKATDVLSELIYNKRVYLDVDDLSITDPYGRYVCLVYADYSATQYINVNKALLVRGVAVMDDFYNNEFNPYEWTLYISKVDTTRFLGYSVGIGLLTTIVFYIIIMRVWNTITGFVRKHGQ